MATYYKLNGGLFRVHSADEDAICGWPIMGHDTHMRRRSTSAGVTDVRFLSLRPEFNSSGDGDLLLLPV